MAKSRKKYKLANDEDCRKNRSGRNNRESKKKKKRESGRSKENNCNNSDINNNSDNGNTNGLSEEDLNSLELLNIEKYATIITFYSDYLYYKTTMEAIDLTSNRNERTAQEQQDFIVYIDREIVTAIRLTLLTRLMFLKVALSRFETIYNRKLNGDFPYSLEANELVIKSLTLKLVGDTYSLQAALEFLRRDGSSFFGI